jgi:hypothetical protein
LAYQDDDWSVGTPYFKSGKFEFNGIYLTEKGTSGDVYIRSGNASKGHQQVGQVETWVPKAKQPSILESLWKTITRAGK